MYTQTTHIDRETVITFASKFEMKKGMDTYLIQKNPRIWKAMAKSKRIAMDEFSVKDTCKLKVVSDVLEDGRKYLIVEVTEALNPAILAIKPEQVEREQEASTDNGTTVLFAAERGIKPGYAERIIGLDQKFWDELAATIDGTRIIDVYGEFSGKADYYYDEPTDRDYIFLSITDIINEKAFV